MGSELVGGKVEGVGENLLVFDLGGDGVDDGAVGESFDKEIGGAARGITCEVGFDGELGVGRDVELGFLRDGGDGVERVGPAAVGLDNIVVDGGGVWCDVEVPAFGGDFLEVGGAAAARSDFEGVVGDERSFEDSLADADVVDAHPPVTTSARKADFELLANVLGELSWLKDEATSGEGFTGGGSGVGAKSLSVDVGFDTPVGGATGGVSSEVCGDGVTSFRGDGAGCSLADRGVGL